MSKFKWMLFVTIFTAACAQKEKHAEISEVIPPPPEVKIENLNLRSARVSMKSLIAHKLLGILNFAQNDANIKVEVHLEGLKSGPYELHLSTSSSCRKINMKNHKDLAQVIADKNGVIKAQTEFSNLLTNELIGKTLVLHTKAKFSEKAVACGVIEKI